MWTHDYSLCFRKAKTPVQVRRRLFEYGVARVPIIELANRLGRSGNKFYSAKVQVERPNKSAVVGNGDRRGGHGDVTAGKLDLELDIFPIRLRRQMLIMAHEEVAAVAIGTRGPVERTASAGRV